MELEYEVELGDFETDDNELFSNESLLEMESTYRKLLLKEAKVEFIFAWLTFGLLFMVMITLFSFNVLVFMMSILLTIFIYGIWNNAITQMSGYLYSLFTGGNDYYKSISEIDDLFSEKVKGEIIEDVKKNLIKVNSLLVGVELSKKELRKSKGLVKEIKNKIKCIKSVDKDNKKGVVRGVFELNGLRKGLSKIIDKYQPKVVIQEQEVEKLSLVKLL